MTKELIAEAQRIQHEMTEGFYDPEIKEKEPEKFIEMNRADMTAYQRDTLKQIGSELAKEAGVSQEAGEAAFFEYVVLTGLEIMKEKWNHNPS